ncbi:3-isopropylmalate/(R)-2-methylmalate dehydratase large subunit [Franzmannia pantelleriensis]|uniref:3-isopropylmalate dehydratase n=1 Tax=Franzmannia pantelleriensis TaxID=48727 RepID=A0A1G9EI03_9GAMM|nr:3-isopropylmalate dehydratase large subunit [Halomonas pantelleriensis]SDK75703.1 3-isopropylmalate/(R)-2-methylmalate dehydratase large subunit [Halomonas pantelleriensis]
MTQPPLTLFEKIWQQHRIASTGEFDLLWVDRHFVHEGSFHAFDKLDSSGRPLAYPELTFGIADHYVPSNLARLDDDPEVAGMIRLLEDNTAKHQLTYLGLGHTDRGIVHVAAPELGLTLPGLIIVCGDSHTTTHGAFGALAMGIGATEVAHVLATQTLWQRRPKTMRIHVSGQLAHGVTAKDLALHIIHQIGTGGATGHAVEYTGPAVANLSMDARMTLCNMTIEAGARVGMVAPDDTTLSWLRDTPRAPTGEALEQAERHWLSLYSDPGAAYDKSVTLDANDVAPRVTWGTSPEQSVAVDEPFATVDSEATHSSLEYMGLNAGQPILGLEVDQVFIGSCTNSRLSDLRDAASVLQGGTVKVPTLIVAGSNRVKAQAEAEGLAEIFRQAGASWGESGCSMCVAMNGDSVAPGQRCASTSNRNFPGRQGPGARTHLMSPAMAAAAALNGKIVDIRTGG